MELSDTGTLGILGTLAHFSHSYLLRQSQLFLTTPEGRGFKVNTKIDCK
jgi:hypothetical protein